jgi:uncharacterized DUF497 family protein
VSLRLQIAPADCSRWSRQPPRHSRLGNSTRSPDGGCSRPTLVKCRPLAGKIECQADVTSLPKWPCSTPIDDANPVQEPRHIACSVIPRRATNQSSRLLPRPFGSDSPGSAPYQLNGRNRHRRPATVTSDRITQVVYWQHFEASEWDIEYDAEKLASHSVSDWEAEEVIFNGFVAQPNKKVHGPNRYQLAGRTDGGRALLLIVHVYGERQMRVLNGWPV